jgi:hypothetical protein
MSAALSAALSSSAFPAFASSRFTGRKLGAGGIKQWTACRERVGCGGWRNFTLFCSFVAMVLVVVLVAGAVMMRSFVVMVRRYSVSRGGRNRCSIIPDIVFLDVHIVHTSVKFSKVTIVTLNKIVGVLHGHSNHGSSEGEGSNKSESRASGRHVY